MFCLLGAELESKCHHSQQFWKEISICVQLTTLMILPINSFCFLVNGVYVWHCRQRQQRKRTEFLPMLPISVNSFEKGFGKKKWRKYGCTNRFLCKFDSGIGNFNLSAAVADSSDCSHWFQFSVHTWTNSLCRTGTHVCDDLTQAKCMIYYYWLRSARAKVVEFASIFLIHSFICLTHLHLAH